MYVVIICSPSVLQIYKNKTLRRSEPVLNYNIAFHRNGKSICFIIDFEVGMLWSLSNYTVLVTWTIH
jgi:hypothetical protein